MGIRELTEEVPEAVETLHCPTCLSARPDGETRCTSCDARPLLLLERELQARIEAETAANFRQRRRAAKVARLIAALPSTVFEDGGAAPAEVEVETEVRSPEPTFAAPIVLELPAAAVRDVRAVPVARPVPDQPAARPAEAVVEIAPSPARVRRERPKPVPRRVAAHPGPLFDVDPAVIEPPAPAPEPAPEPKSVPKAREAKSALTPRPAVKLWEPANPAWKNRVFNSADSRKQTVTWPRPPAHARDGA